MMRFVSCLESSAFVIEWYLCFQDNNIASYVSLSVQVAEMASQERLVSFGSRFVEIKRAQHLSSAQRATNGDFSRQPNISQLPSSPQKNKAGGLPQQQNFKTEKPGPTLYRDPEQAGNMAGRRNLNRAWAGGMSENWKQDPGSGMLRGQQRGPGLQKHNFAPGPKPNHFQVRNANNMPPRGGPHNGPPNAMMNPGPASPGTEPSMSMPGPTPGAAFMGQGAQVSDEAGQWPGPLWGYMAAPPDQGGPASMGPVPFAMHPGMAMAWPPQWAVPGMPPGWVPMPMPMGFVASPNMMPVPPGMAGFGQAPFNPALPHLMMMGGYGLDEEEMEGGMSALNLQGEGREPADSDAEHQEGGGAVVVGPDSDATEGSAQARAHRQADDTERDHDPEEEGPPPLAAECGVNGFNESSDAAAAEESESGRQG